MAAELDQEKHFAGVPVSVRWDDGLDSLVILDQTKLPSAVEYLSLQDHERVAEAIKTLQVRGAPAIGIAGSFGLYLGLRNRKPEHARDLLESLRDIKAFLVSTRPTAVNLAWALDRMERAAASSAEESVDEILSTLLAEAKAILTEDAAVCRAIGENGLALLEKGWGLLTHCNAGSIATARWGTALAPIHLGQERGYGFSVFADETRPLLQGARLTAWELSVSGAKVTLICDNMAASVMASGAVQAVLVGCDRVAANGDVANKIGTLSVAILARHFGIPFYVHAPLSTIDPRTPDGSRIPIELRSPEEIRSLWYRVPMAPEGIAIHNPAFDVTPAELVTAIITEKGVLRPPYGESIAKVLAS